MSRPTPLPAQPMKHEGYGRSIYITEHNPVAWFDNWRKRHIVAFDALECPAQQFDPGSMSREMNKVYGSALACIPARRAGPYLW